jgi:transcriptional regulator with XRE-family HTH domain
MNSRAGGQGRTSTKAKLAEELNLLGRILVRTRERAGLKQSEVAGALGLPASYVSKVENGTRRLDVIELVRIADAMHTDPAAILAELQRELKRVHSS